MEPRKHEGGVRRLQPQRRRVGRPRPSRAADQPRRHPFSRPGRRADPLRHRTPIRARAGRGRGPSRHAGAARARRRGELGRPQGGRAPRHVRLRTNAGAVLVAHVDRMSLAVGIANLAGNLIVEHHEAADLALGPEPILESADGAFLWLLDERGGKAAAWAIAVALPEAALVDANDGNTFGIATLDALRAWRAFDFAAELSLRFGAPALARSNTQMMTLGEIKAGAGLGRREPRLRARSIGP